MNLRRRSKLTSEVSTHSLNDIMFFLLLFFLIASTMANPNVIKVLLPKAESQQEITKVQYDLTITKDLKYYHKLNEIPKSDLEKTLSSWKDTNKDVTVVLRIDAEVDWQDVVKVLDIGKKLNIKMVAATKK